MPYVSVFARAIYNDAVITAIILHIEFGRSKLIWCLCICFSFVFGFLRLRLHHYHRLLRFVNFHFVAVCIGMGDIKSKFWMKTKKENYVCTVSLSICAEYLNWSSFYIINSMLKRIRACVYFFSEKMLWRKSRWIHSRTLLFRVFFSSFFSFFLSSHFFT